MQHAEIEAFFDPATFTISYVVYGEGSSACAIIDPVLDYDPKAARISTASAQKIVDFVQQNNLKVEWILETHAHADHLSSAHWLKQQVGGKVAIGEHIPLVQAHFARLYNFGDDFLQDGSQFDYLFNDGEKFSIGNLQVEVLFTPGHTPACVSYKVEESVFVGDTLFMPDYGTARTDFPGGDAKALYDSIQKILSLPDDTRLFMCHDYLPGGREPKWETTVAEQRKYNVLVNESVQCDEFVTTRNGKDAGLAAPVLILPSLQVNISAGVLPEPESNDVRYLKIPLNQLG